MTGSEAVTVIEVLFFGRVREELGCDRLQTAAASDLDTLQERLVREHGGRWSEVLGQANIIRAVNQTVAAGNARLQDGDEVAFFPPVTGG